MRRTLALALAMALTGCSTGPGLKPFTSDGCSLFPDRALIGTADWCACCLAHDLAYWRGGTEAERAQADTQFEACVLAATGDPKLARMMRAGVRLGGTPHLPTHFRWGYGWPYERGYAALTPAEQEEADRLARRSDERAACDH